MATQEMELIRDVANGRLSRRAALRLGVKGGLGLAALVGVLAAAPDASAKTIWPKKIDKIEPNCIFVCCDEKCDDFCYKCVEWPKPPKSALMSRE